MTVKANTFAAQQEPSPATVEAKAPSYADGRAFARLYDETYLEVFRYVYGLCGGPQQEAEDITAETYLRAWRSRGRFQGDVDAALGWLLQIARRLVIDAGRRSRVRPPEGELPDAAILAAPGATPEAHALHREQVSTLWGLLHTLADDEREIVVLRYLVGWPVKRIAHRLAHKPNTVSVRLKRTLAKLRERWPDSIDRSAS